jgi:hypothetical protein
LPRGAWRRRRPQERARGVDAARVAEVGAHPQRGPGRRGPRDRARSRRKGRTRRTRPRQGTKSRRGGRRGRGSPRARGRRHRFPADPSEDGPDARGRAGCRGSRRLRCSSWRMVCHLCPWRSSGCTARGITVACGAVSSSPPVAMFCGKNLLRQIAQRECLRRSSGCALSTPIPPSGRGRSADWSRAEVERAEGPDARAVDRVPALPDLGDFPVTHPGEQGYRSFNTIPALSDSMIALTVVPVRALEQTTVAVGCNPGPVVEGPRPVRCLTEQRDEG